VGNGTTTSLLPDPDFTCTATDCKFVAGIRPYRQTTFRLEPQTVGTKFIVHNYGHGGAGITMCWGCAVEVRELVRQHTGGTPRPVAVLGAGVMGLTAAAQLVDAGYSVGIYASSLLSTTSDIAGGQWQPSFVEHEPTAAAKHRFETILRTSFAMHRDRIGQGYGVSKRINYSKHGSGTSFDKVPHDVIPPPMPYAHLPFAHLNVPGFGYHTLLVEPPIFLKKLRDDLSAAGVPFTQKEFHSPGDVAQLAEPVVVNCTGMGSKEIFGDNRLVPIKGHLVLLKRQLTCSTCTAPTGRMCSPARTMSWSAAALSRVLQIPRCSRRNVRQFCSWPRTCSPARRSCLSRRSRGCCPYSATDTGDRCPTSPTTSSSA
jgi:D-amino-acid oxidase